MGRKTSRYKEGDLIGGRFEVDQVLMGGMGEVYLGYDSYHKMPLALKTFQANLSDPRARKLFNDEVYNWVKLGKHPNIVRCYHLDTIDNQPFMLLEWVAGVQGKGTNLRSWLCYGPLELRQALDFTIDICRGLIHAQQKQPGIVHRDLKPENILINGSHQAKITDFGLAMVAQQANITLGESDQVSEAAHTLGGVGHVVGTPPYMPPEQWHGEPLDARADIYAIGCILHEMLTGRWPFTVRNKSLSAWQRAHEQASPAALPADFPAALQNLLLTCLAKEPVNRFATVSTLLQELIQFYTEHFSEPPQPLSDITAFTDVDYINRGATYNKLGRYEEALSDLGGAIDLNPHHYGAYSNRGATYYELEHFDLALLDLGRAIDLNSHDAYAYLNRGVTYNKLGRFEEALSDYGWAVDINPHYADVYYNRGNTYQNLGRYEEALSDYGWAINLDRHHADAYVSRGATYDKLGRNQEALSDYERAITLDPHRADAYYNREMAYEKLGRYQEAWSDYSQAIDLNPNDYRAYTNRGAIYNKLGRFEEALSDFGRAIDLNSHYAEAYLSRGLTFHDLGCYEEALLDYERVIALNSHNAHAYLNRGMTYDKLGRIDEALRDYKQAIDIEPHYAEAYLSIGILFGNQDKLREAQPYFEKAAQLGNQMGAQYAARARQMLGQAASSQANPSQMAFEAFPRATSAAQMQAAVAQHPLMVSDSFIGAVVRVIEQRVPVERRAAFEQRLGWLRQIAQQ